jgi:hypothetical protein
MAAGAVSRASAPQHDVRWKWLLLTFCALATAWIVAEAIDNLGWGSRSWYGWWDGPSGPSDQPYTVVFTQPVPGGATALAGIRGSDRIDAREQTLAARIVLFTQPMATLPTTFIVRRDSRSFTVRMVGSTVWEGEAFWKLLGTLTILISGVWFLACGLLISVRRWWSSDGRALALILLFLVPGYFNIQFIMFPNAIVNLLSFATLQACAFAALILLVRLSWRFGSRSPWRRIVEGVAYAAVAFDVLWHAAFYAGILTLRIDPVPFWSANYAVSFVDFGVTLIVAVLAATAVAWTTPSERPRAAWLLLPLPFALSASAVAGYLSASTDSWFAVTSLQILSGACVLAGAFLVTYALLKRRVLDLGFVLSRTIVVAVVSLIVVTAFVLLEWILGSVLADVSHATGLIANACLALVLGVSLRYIHRHVDTVVDSMLFRKRHQDERALLDFSNEASYVTEPDALLDQAIAKIQLHTDARNAGVLLGENGSFTSARSFGEDVHSVSENDGAILALKTWHRPLDPHHYATALKGALAVPMVARGRLLGILLLGERAGGEAYAPDEVDALSQFAHGVGSSLDALARSPDSLTATQSLVAMQQTLAAMQQTLNTMQRAKVSRQGIWR